MDQSTIVMPETIQDGQTEANSSPNHLWNEGRVVGYSAYEVYVRQHMLEDPNTPPASEREWLAASLAMGSSILVRVPERSGEAETDHHVMHIPLPKTTQLCAANTILASFFYGEGELLDDFCACRVKSYGSLVPNNTDTHPISGPVNSEDLDSILKIPHPNSTQLSTAAASELKQVRDYMRIFDGVVLHPGTWEAPLRYKVQEKDGTYRWYPFEAKNRQDVIDQYGKDAIFVPTDDTPEQDFIPKLVRETEEEELYPTLRLHVKGPITTSFWMLLTGFTMRSIVSGESKYDTGSVVTDHPENGGYLGPETFPWASKIVFSVPTSAVRYDALYKRAINGGTEKEIQDTAIIDMRECDPARFYPGGSHPATVSLQVHEDFVSLKDGAAVLTVYQRDDSFGPALYGTLIDRTDTAEELAEKRLAPLDTVAPRTIKLFHGNIEDTEARNLLARDFEKNIPLNFALIRCGSDYVLRQVAWKKRNNDGTPKTDEGNEIVPVADAEVVKEGNQYHAIHKHGTTLVTTISLIDQEGRLLEQTGSNSTKEEDTLTWKLLLDALGLNESIDVTGKALRQFKKLLQRIFEDGDGLNTTDQYVVKVKEVGDNYTIEFVKIDPSKIISCEVENTANSRYVLNITTGGDTYKAISLTKPNSQGKQTDLPLNGQGGTQDYSDTGEFSWHQLLKSLYDNKTIKLVNDLLIQLASALPEADEVNQGYLIQKTESGFSMAPPAKVNIPKFPSYVLEGIRLTPCDKQVTCPAFDGDTRTSGKKSFVGELVLDVFGYVSEHGKDPTTGKPEFTSFNTFSTLTHTRGDLYVTDTTSDGGGAFGVVQEFFVNTNSLGSWANVCKGLMDAEVLKAGHNKVRFTSGGRPIYNNYSTKHTPANQICAPAGLLGITACIEPVYRDAAGQLRKLHNNAAVTDGGQVRGLIMWVDNAARGWGKSAPSAGSYTGSLVGDSGSINWYPNSKSNIWTFERGWHSTE